MAEEKGTYCPRCNERLYAVTEEGKLLDYACLYCDLGIGELKQEYEKHEQLERIQARLEFKPDMSPYKVKKWVKPGHTKRKRIKNILIDTLIVVVGTCTVILTWALLNGRWPL